MPREPAVRSARLRVAGLALIALLLTGSALVGAVPAAARATVVAPTLSVVNVSPNTPQISNRPRPLTFLLRITNNDPDTNVSISISASRSDPIGSSEQLDSTLAHPRPPSPDLVSPLTATAMAKTIAPGQSVVRPLRTTTGSYNAVHAHNGVCLCNTYIYPFWFIGNYTIGDVSGEVTTQTYLPSFTTAPKTKSTVSWVWPLLDRPHRLLRSTVFLDDVLADEVGDGGRLYRLLQVVQQVSPDVPMTIVTDPDLIDELAVMSTGNYRVDTANGLIPGTGQAAAARWLRTLRVVLTDHPDVKLVFTPFADPAVDSLTRAHMSWSADLDSAARARVSTALGGRTPSSDLAWPVGRSIAANTLAELVNQGAKTVLVSDSALSQGNLSPTPNALAPLGTATLAVTSARLQRLVAQILDPTSTDGLGLLPELVARLAVDLIEKPAHPHYTVLTPPRDLDIASVPTAVQTIEATANTVWSSPLTVEAAAADRTITQVGRGSLNADVHSPQLGRGLLGQLRQVSNNLKLLTSLFHDQSVGTRLAAPVPAAVQRAESTSLISDRETAQAMADRLLHVVNHTRRRVYIVRPAYGTYTLTSADSQLPITVVNRLNAEIDVRISVDAADGESGVTSTSADTGFTIKANSKVQEHIPLHVDRVGKIRLIARIRTPSGLLLGYGKRETPLSVRSTALGTIGVVITILAAIALALAVIVRQIRRIRRRADKPPPQEPQPPVAATTASSVP